MSSSYVLSQAFLRYLRSYSLALQLWMLLFHSYELLLVLDIGSLALVLEIHVQQRDDLDFMLKSRF